MDLLHPARLWLLVLVAALAGLHVAAGWRRQRRAARFTNLELLESVVPSSASWPRHLVAGGLLAGFTIGVFGLAQPYRLEQAADERSIIMLLLDVSLSMEADDVPPSRLEAARAQALDFVESVDPSIEVGFISFSEAVRLRVSPTLDREAVTSSIASVGLDEGTAIGDAIAAATDTILAELGRDPVELPDDGAGPPSTDTDDAPDAPDDAAAEPPPAAIVLLSDGETVVGRPTADGAALAAAAGIPVHTISFGTPEGTIALLDPNTGVVEDQPVPVNVEELAAVADVTGGTSYAAETEGALRDAYADIEAALEPALQQPEPVVVDLTVRWLAAAMAVLALAVVTGWWLLGGIA